LKKVLIGRGKQDFPEELANELKELADMVYISPMDVGYYDELKDADAIIAGMEKVDDNFLKKATKLGIVARFGVGYDSVDVGACTKRGIHVTHTPDVLSGAVADLTWGLILSQMRGLVKSDAFVRNGWEKRTRRLSFGHDTEGKTLGIIGLGRIGIEVVKRAKGFDVDVIYYDVFRNEKAEDSLGIKYMEFTELLKSSDVVSIHVPLLPSTKHLIGINEFKIMKKSAIIVNTARGSVIDQSALVTALNTGLIGGAALDVFEEEPLRANDALISVENTVLTSHIGSATVETRRKMAEVCAINVRAFLEGKTPPNLVPEQRS
jgi:glyoxylate reductase